MIKQNNTRISIKKLIYSNDPSDRLQMTKGEIYDFIVYCMDVLMITFRQALKLFKEKNIKRKPFKVVVDNKIVVSEDDSAAFFKDTWDHLLYNKHNYS